MIVRIEATLLLIFIKNINYRTGFYVLTWAFTGVFIV